MKILFISVKGYLRKGAILTAMKEHTKAAQCFTKALEIDPNNAVSTFSLINLLKQFDFTYFDSL